MALLSQLNIYVNGSSLKNMNISAQLFDRWENGNGGLLFNAETEMVIIKV